MVGLPALSSRLAKPGTCVHAIPSLWGTRIVELFSHCAYIGHPTPILLLFFVKVTTVAADWLVLGLLLGTGSGSLTLLLNHRRSGRSLSPRYHSALCLVKQCQYPVKLAVGGHFLFLRRLDDRHRRRDRFWLIQAWSDLSRKGDTVVEFHHSSCISAKSRTLTKESNRSWLGVLIPTSMTSVSPQNELVLFLQC